MTFGARGKIFGRDRNMQSMAHKAHPYVAQNNRGEWVIFNMMGTPHFSTYYSTREKAEAALELWQEEGKVL